MYLGWYRLDEPCDDDFVGDNYTFDKIPEDIC